MFKWLDEMMKEIDGEKPEDNNGTEIKISEKDLDRIADTVIEKLSTSKPKDKKPKSENDNQQTENEKLKSENDNQNDNAENDNQNDNAEN